MNPQSQVVVRTGTAHDAPQLLKFLKHFREEQHPGVFRSARALPTLEEEEAWIGSLLEQHNSNLWVACDDAQIVGLLDFHGHPHPQMAHGGAFGISVLAPYRGQSIGLQLMQALIAWASEHPDLRRIELEVFSNNRHAIHFYERLGFLHEGRRRGAVLVNGQPIDMLRMGRAVSQPENG